MSDSLDYSINEDGSIDDSRVSAGWIVAVGLTILLAGFTVIALIASLAAPAQPNYILQHADTPNVIMLMHDGLDDVAPLWQTEVARRFPTNTVCIVGHGGGPLGNQWMFEESPDRIVPMADEVRTVQAEYPGRTVCIISCDPDHLKLTGFPGVFQFTSSVWVVPDRAVESAPDPDAANLTLDGQVRSRTDPDVAGNVFEMIPCN